MLATSLFRYLWSMMIRLVFESDVFALHLLGDHLEEEVGGLVYGVLINRLVSQALAVEGPR